MTKESKEARKFGLKDKIGYALGDAGNDFTLVMLQSYLLVFYTKVLGVEGAIIGTMFLVTKFVDAFTDTAMGRIIDTHTDKNGDRFRPWIKRFAIPVVVSSVLIYNTLIVGWPMWAKVAYVSVVYLIYGSICYTGINIPYGAMAAVISADPKEKTSLSTFRSIGALIAAMVLGVIIPMVVYDKDAAGNSVVIPSRFPMLAIIFGMIALLCYYLCYKWTTERIHIPNKEPEKGDLWKSVKTVVKDRAILSIILISITVVAAQGIISSLNQYLFLDYFNNTKLLSLASFAMMGSMFIMAPFATNLSSKFGKKEISVVGLGIATVAYLVCFISRTHNPIFYLIVMTLSFMGVGLFFVISWSMITDCIDNYYIEHGVRQDGTIYAMYSFLKKLAGAVTGSIGAWSLTLIGYDNTAATQTTGVSSSIFNISVGVPLIFFAITFILMAFMYPINKKKIDDNALKLKEMMEAQK